MLAYDFRVIYFSLSLILQIYYLVFKDLNVFSEKKTNLGLFVLKSKLNFKMFCTGQDILSNTLLLRNMKIYNF